MTNHLDNNTPFWTSLFFNDTENLLKSTLKNQDFLDFLVYQSKDIRQETESNVTLLLNKEFGTK